jgi:porin
MLPRLALILIPILSLLAVAHSALAQTSDTVPDTTVAGSQGKDASPTKIQWFPSKQPDLASYLSGLDKFSDSALQPGALLQNDPLSRWAQHVKEQLANFGFSYQLQHALGYTTRPDDILSGSEHVGYSSFELYAKQLVFHVPDSGTAGWLSFELDGGTGLGTSGRRTNPAAVLGSLADPAGILSPVNGVYLSELAWQQSFAHGTAVIVAGMVDLTNYLDNNTYASSSFSQFQNSAFLNSMVLPITSGGLGINVQWQPADDRYFLLGVAQNNESLARSPLNHLEVSHMSYLFEAGYVPPNFLGLGPGAYRLQPFVATVDGVNQGGIGLNINQQLSSQLGFFGRLGVGGAKVSNIQGASTQIATGLVLQNPLKLVGLRSQDSNDFLGIGFVWSQPSKSQRPAAHFNEYGLELVYTFQLTATMLLKPDLQTIWNPVNSRQGNVDVLFQLPLVMTW